LSLKFKIGTALEDTLWKMKSKVLEEIKRLRNAGEINEETYWRLKRIIEKPLEIDLGKIFDKYGIFGNGLVLDIAAGGSGTGPKILGDNIIAFQVFLGERFYRCF